MSEDTPKLIIAGIPRTGTRYLTNKLGGKSFKAIHGNLVKTHGLAPPDSSGDPRAETVAERLLRGGYKAIFMFGDPVYSVVSTMRNIYDRNHFKNCGLRNPPDNMDITTKDWLGYERMFDSWMQYHGYPVLALRYETLPNHAKELHGFTGVDIDFSDWGGRKTNIDAEPPELLKRICDTYASLIRKAIDAEDCTLFGEAI